MFSALGVPTLALVENMSFFDGTDGTRHYPFGKGIQDFVETMSEISPENICQLPLSSTTNDATDEGTPLTLSRPEDAVAELEAMSKLARIVSRELLKQPFLSESSGGKVSFDEGHEMFDLSSIQLSLDGGDFLLRAFAEQGAVQRRIAANDLRARDPKTGETIRRGQDLHDSPSDTKIRGMVEIHRSQSMKGTNASPDRLEKKGKVGFEVVWGDGSKFIYSRRALAIAAGGRLHNIHASAANKRFDS